MNGKHFILVKEINGYHLLLFFIESWSSARVCRSLVRYYFYYLLMICQALLPYSSLYYLQMTVLCLLRLLNKMLWNLH